jgi:hypothetical protein
MKEELLVGKGQRNSSVYRVYNAKVLVMGSEPPYVEGVDRTFENDEDSLGNNVEKYRTATSHPGRRTASFDAVLVGCYTCQLCCRYG